MLMKMCMNMLKKAINKVLRMMMRHSLMCLSILKKTMKKMLMKSYLVENEYGTDGDNSRFVKFNGHKQVNEVQDEQKKRRQFEKRKRRQTKESTLREEGK